jgi:hypothetical protein
MKWSSYICLDIKTFKISAGFDGVKDIIRRVLDSFISFPTRHESTNVYIKLILEDIRRTAEHASDIAEAAMNETVSEVIEKVPSSHSHQ